MLGKPSSEIPNDILQEIICSISDVQHVVKCSMVSKSFQSLARCTESVHIRGITNIADAIEFLPLFLSRCSHLKELKISLLEDVSDGMEEALRSLPKTLVSLTLDVKCTYKSIVDILARLASLKEFHLHHATLGRVPSDSPVLMLRMLKLSYVEFGSVPIEDYVRLCPALEELYIEHCKTNPESYCATYLSEVVWSFRLQSSTLQFFRLRCLRVMCFELKTPNLRVLDSLTPSLKHFILDAPLLQVLKMDCCYAPLAHLSSMHNLEYAYILGSIKLPLKLKQILTGSQRLKWLRLHQQDIVNNMCDEQAKDDDPVFEHVEYLEIEVVYHMFLRVWHLLDILLKYLPYLKEICFHGECFYSRDFASYLKNIPVNAKVTSIRKLSEDFLPPGLQGRYRFSSEKD